MSSVKRVIALGFVTSAMLLSGLVLASNLNDDHSDNSDQHAGKTQQRMAQRMSELKAKLAITAEQESSWSDFQAAMQRPGKAMSNKEAQQAKREAMKAMTTPQRLDARQAMKHQQDVRMTIRTDAIRTLYSELTPTQQSVFDNALGKMMGSKKGGKHSGERDDRIGY